MKKIYLELMPAMDKERGKIRITGTPLAEDCMISRLRTDPAWTCGHFPICNGDIDDPVGVGVDRELMCVPFGRGLQQELEGLVVGGREDHVAVRRGAAGES